MVVNNPAEVRILDIKIHPVTYPEVLSRIEAFLKDNRSHHLVTVNPEFMILAQNDAGFKEILNGADLSVADGVGIYWAAKILGRPIPGRVTGTDLIEEIAREAESKGWRLFFLGAAEGVAEAAAKMLKIRYPQIRIVGTFSGNGNPEGDKETIQAVTEAGKIDILFVAYGQSKQEKWINRNLSKTEAKIAIGIGGGFDYLSGAKKRAPEFLRQTGFEWLYRLLKEPARWKRQLALPKFVYLVFKEKLKI